MDSLPIRKLTGNEYVISNLELEDATVQNFWQWAFSNLLFNDVRGVFAEWLVAKLLNIPLSNTIRDSWGEWDLLTSEGVKIEVKTSAYLQAWKQKGRYSQIKFSGLKGQVFNPELNRHTGEATFNADIYVLCLQIHRDKQTYNALDLEQWRFLVLTKAEMKQKNYRSLTLSDARVEKESVTASEFCKKANELIQRVVNEQRKPEEQ